MLERCTAETAAFRVAPRTLPMIHTLDDSVTLEPMKQTYFMIYCVDTDHEEYQVIDEEVFNRTYGEMPKHVVAMHVTTID